MSTGRVIDSANGNNDEIMRPVAWNVGSYLGKEAHLEITDSSSDGWGHILGRLDQPGRFAEHFDADRQAGGRRHDGAGVARRRRGPR